ncbi:MAG TPA: c-type cytochrome, partial [Verrucomicrobia bacterium]|nr:c-type cytochrome [Verrucomicrobiota bacterium]
DHPNGWHRSTAARLLFERQNQAAVEPLRRLAKRGKTGLGRMHALHALAGLDALKRSDLVAVTTDYSPVVRTHAIRLAERFLPKRQAGIGEKPTGVTPLTQSLLRLAEDHDKHVRFQLAWTLGTVEFPDKADALAKLFRQAGADHWQLVALLNAATEQHAELIDELNEDTTFAKSIFSEIIFQNLETMRAGRLAKFSIRSKKSVSLPQVFKPAGKVDPDRAKVVEQFRPALAKRGDAKRGRVTFEQRCAACHELGGVGRNIGPDLKSVRANGAEKLLVSIIDPNREVAPQYVLHKVYSAKKKETIVGTIKYMSGSAMAMGLPDGSERQFFRSAADLVESTGMSLMPAGLEAGLSAGQMADLLAWVLEAE